MLHSVKFEKDENGYLLSDFQNISNRSFLQVIECAQAEDVRQTEIHTTDALVPEPNAYEARLLLTSWEV